MSEQKTMKKAVRKRCHNCAHASGAFKVGGDTHHHCTHPARVEGIPEDELSAWDTLVDWHNTCDRWEQNIKEKPKHKGKTMSEETIRLAQLAIIVVGIVLISLLGGRWNTP